jgi:predicted  nucleic acid-binding Zn-ribbon protein
MSSKNNTEKRRNQINAEVDDKNEAMKGVQSGIKLIEEELALLSSKYNESSKMIGNWRQKRQVFYRKRPQMINGGWN